MFTGMVLDVRINVAKIDKKIMVGGVMKRSFQ